MAGDQFHTNGGSIWWKMAPSKDRFEAGTISSSGGEQHSNMGTLFGWSSACTDSVSMVSAACDAQSNVNSHVDWTNVPPIRRVVRGDPGFRPMHQESTGGSEEPGFEMDLAMYGSPSAILQSALENRPYVGNSYGLNSSTHELLPPLMTRSSPPLHFGHLQSSNNAPPFWNASMKGNSGQLSFAPSSSSLQCHPQQHFPNDEKSMNLSEANMSSKITVETSSKRNRSGTPSPLPAFKVRKEKMGDRITALQQLVSPFGKTDTASVLSEAIEHIKILHEQVQVLSSPYLKRSDTSMHHYHRQEKGPERQKQEEMEEEEVDDEQKQDLRSRGLCLVPMASTFPVAHEPSQLDWTPPFGGPFR
ncbi:hypothetical protein SAY87_004116 [Trapa incisa]|uniref:BHLH domain-containing protein n=1 Tax=Trapa incisa TaxID=236973 RepID=A0AAN7PLI9_9MYRT|nr:hypothetical protein SAY87_004116 [Trapa incisa]